MVVEALPEALARLLINMVWRGRLIIGKRDSLISRFQRHSGDGVFWLLSAKTCGLGWTGGWTCTNAEKVL